MFLFRTPLAHFKGQLAYRWTCIMHDATYMCGYIYFLLVLTFANCHCWYLAWRYRCILQGVNTVVKSKDKVRVANCYGVELAIINNESQWSVFPWNKDDWGSPFGLHGTDEIYVQHLNQFPLFRVMLPLVPLCMVYGRLIGLRATWFNCDVLLHIFSFDFSGHLTWTKVSESFWKLAPLTHERLGFVQLVPQIMWQSNGVSVIHFFVPFHLRVSLFFCLVMYW